MASSQMPFVLIAVLAVAAKVYAQDQIVVGFQFPSYNTTEGSSVNICVEIISPPDIASTRVYIEVVVNDNNFTSDGKTGATQDEVHPILGEYLMSADADYSQPLEGAIGQIYNRPLSQSARSVCYEQQTYQDSVVEGDEYFSLRVATERRTPSNVIIDSALSTTLVKILDDDIHEIMVGLERDNYSVNEGEEVEFCINIDHDSAVNSSFLKFNLSLRIDYFRVEIDICISNSRNNCEIVFIEDNNILEKTHSVPVTLHSNDSRVFVVRNGVLTSTDNNEAQVGLQLESYTVSEESTNVRVCVQVLYPPSNCSIGFPFSLLLSASDVTAVSPFDYLSLSSLIMFKKCETIKCQEINITNDETHENLEVFSVELHAPAELDPRIIVNPNYAEVLITDNDVVEVGFERTYYAVVEEIGSMDVCLVITNPMVQCPVAYSFSIILLALPESAASGDDYNFLWQSLTFPMCEQRICVSIPIVDNNELEGTESFTLSIFRNDLDAHINLGPTTATAEIIDIDRVEVGLEQTIYEAIEGRGSISVCAALINAYESCVIPFPFLLTFSAQDGSAVSPDDYENVYTVERFPSCVQRICVLISITNDKLPEETETFHVVLSEGPNFDERIRLIPTLADVVITDDEVFVGFSRMSYTVIEGSNVTVCITVLNAGHIGSNQIYLQVITDDTLETGPEATRDTVDVNGNYNMIPDADYPPPLLGQGQIYNQPIIESLKSVCYSQQTYDDDVYEGVEYFSLRVTTETRTLPEIGIHSLHSNATIKILDNDRVTCPELKAPDNGVISVTGNCPGDTALYTCNQCYNLVGVEFFTCGSSGVWSSEPPLCTRGSSSCTDGDIRLFGGTSKTEGQVQVCQDCTWGTVCNDFWDDREARVVCRQLGLSSGFSSAKEYTAFRSGDGPIFLDNLHCFGHENSLLDCRHNGVGNHDCTHFEDAGVVCYQETDCEFGDVRLANGNTTAGRVEVCYNGVWSKVCGNLWDENDARVVCRQLGLPFNFPRALHTTLYEEGDGPTFLGYVQCSGDEMSLQQCHYYYTEECAYYSDASVSCSNEPECEHGEARLVGGHEKESGRVEVCVNGVWGTVCFGSWSANDARVLCRQLGFPSSFPKLSYATSYGQGDGPIHILRFECSGDEDSLLNCSVSEVYYSCSHREDVTVQCSDSEQVICEEGYFLCPDYFYSYCLPKAYICDRNHNCQDGYDEQHCGEDENCQNGEIRLRDGTFKSEGRVEVCVNGTWGTICDTSWDDNDARVVCGQLGYSTNFYTAIGNSEFGMGQLLPRLNNVNCVGSEDLLLNCSYEMVKEFVCTHYSDAGVLCYNETGCTDGELRLADGNSTAGRVEVCFDGVWGRVCGKHWDINNAKVVCTQLGLSSTYPRPIITSTFGEGDGPIVLDNLQCNGKEDFLTDCPHNGVGIHMCTHHNDASVFCADEAECIDGDIQLVDGAFATEGRVHVCVNGTWGTLCGDQWDDEDAKVICRQLGLSTEFFKATRFGNGERPMLLYHSHCTGEEESLFDCLQDESNDYDSASCDNAGAVCYYETDCENGEVHLADGNTTAGRVEICLHGVWGTVCDDYWDMDDARVVCRQLGLPYEIPKALRTSQYGEGYGPVLLNHLRCSGDEVSLIQCSHSGGHYCDHSKDASVVCSNVSDCETGQVRLSNEAVGGRYGRVEVCVDRVWGTLCSRSWSAHDARVLCRQLGLPSLFPRIFLGGLFGEGKGPIHMGYLDCTGDEVSVFNCPFLPSRDHSCGHHEVATVGCSEYVAENSASEYFVAFGANHPSRMENASLKLFISSTEPEPVFVTVETFRGFDFTGFVTNNEILTVEIPNSFQMLSCKERDKGIRITAADQKKIHVHAINNARGTADSFLLLPSYRVPANLYEYYGVSYSGSPLSSFIIVVGVEDNTTLRIGSETLELNEMETYLWESNAITGTRIVSNKPLAVFVGHRCTFVPQSFRYCDHLSEQVPPTATWGTKFLSASHQGRASGELYRILASQQSTTVSVNCSTFDRVLIYTLGLPGSWEEFTTSAMSYCSIMSDKPILVMQYALGFEIDEVGDPFMMMVVPVEQYSNNYIIQALPEFGTNYITIYVPSKYFQLQSIFVNDINLGHSSWTTVYDSNSEICGHVAYANLTFGKYKVYHTEVSAHLGVSVYGFDRATSYGYPGGIQLDPLQYQHPCEEGFYLCPDYSYLHCLPNSSLCDSIANCADGYDEHFCGDCSNGDIRLVDGTFTTGRVEFCYGGMWGTVCDGSWDDEDARVACRQLGFSDQYSIALSFGRSRVNRPVLLDNTQCWGYESSLIECPSGGIGVQNCVNQNDAAAVCFPETTCEEGDLRLADGDSRAGRVEVCHGRMWGTVCNENWGMKDAMVICRQLGLPNSFPKALHTLRYGKGEGIILANFGCKGNELQLRDCPYYGGRRLNCGHHQDAGVFCSDEKECESGRVRLVDGTTTEGRVEVCVNGTWGTVCSRNWNVRHGRVVCRQLGLPSAVPRLFTDASHGEGDGPIHMAHLDCTGHENSLLDCSYHDAQRHTCGHQEDASLECSDEDPCGEEYFYCPNDYYIHCYHNRYLCDSEEHCFDGYDEQNCTKVECPYPKEFSNGSVSISGVLPGSIAVYSCNNGYELVGDPIQVCRENLTLSGKVPICRPLCPHLNDPLHGSVEVTGYSIGDIANYSCSPGYDLVGESAQTCTNDSSWTDKLPVCEAQCRKLTHPEFGFVLVSGNSINDSANYTCDDGYELVGESTMYCKNGGEWSSDPPVCTALCPPLNNPINGTVEVTLSLTKQMATFTCDPGFGLVGMAVLSCESNRTWSGELPFCMRIGEDCPISQPCDGCCPEITCPSFPPVDCPTCPPTTCSPCPTITYIPSPTQTPTPASPTGPPAIPGNVENVRSPECGIVEWDAPDGGDGGLSYKIRLYSGQSFSSTPSSQRIVLTSLTNSLTFTVQDIPSGRPLYAIIKARNSAGKHSRAWSTPIIAAEAGCPD